MNPFNPCLTAADSQAKRQRERRTRRKPLRTALYLVAAIVLTAFLLALSGCVESSKHTTLPDGTKIEEHSKQADPNVLRFGADVVRAYSPREIKRVREEKSGRISEQEIADRFKPLYGPKLP
jgi:predicted component of type VI protein secretion system